MFRMFRKHIPAAAALPLLLIPLALGCETGGGNAKSASNSSAVPASVSAKPAAAKPAAGSAQGAIPAGSARLADPVYGYVDEVRSELSDGKVALINRVMRLT